VDYCPNCQTTLAREQVIGDDKICERCKTPVIKKELDQWYFRTTDYADELLSFEGIDWPSKIQDMQTNWIGRSEGASVQFPVISNQSSVTSKLNTEHSSLITVFTTRPDTLWGATFMVLAPEHPLVETIDHARTTCRRRSLHRRKPPAKPTSNAKPPTKKKPASSPAGMLSTPSTAHTFRSGSPTTC
jgi:leucyl-tRNA synthetase